MANSPITSILVQTKQEQEHPFRKRRYEENDVPSAIAKRVRLMSSRSFIIEHHNGDADSVWLNLNKLFETFTKDLADIITNQGKDNYDVGRCIAALDELGSVQRIVQDSLLLGTWK